MPLDNKAEIVLAYECIAFGTVIIIIDLIVICFKFLQLKKQEWVSTQLSLILIYAVFKVIYAWCLFEDFQRKWLHFEQVVVGIEQFLILLIIWRVLLQYITAAYNITKFTNFMTERGKDVWLMDFMDYKLQFSFKNEYRTNMLAKIVFLFFAILVSISYLG